MCCSSYRLQVEHETASNKHQIETCELKLQLNRLNTQVERGNQALQQKTQVRNTSLHLHNCVKPSEMCSAAIVRNAQKLCFFLHRMRKRSQR